MSTELSPGVAAPTCRHGVRDRHVLARREGSAVIEWRCGCCGRVLGQETVITPKAGNGKPRRKKGATP